MLIGSIVLIFQMDKNQNQTFQKFWNLTGWIYRYVNLRCCENFQSEQQEQTSPSVCISLFELFHLSVRSRDCLYFCFESQIVFVDFHQYETGRRGVKVSPQPPFFLLRPTLSLFEKPRPTLSLCYTEPALEPSLWDFSGKIICKAHPWKRNPDVDVHTLYCWSGPIQLMLNLL